MIWLASSTGRSLAELWSRPPGGPITLSWTVTARSLDEAEAEIAASQQRGYRNFNLKVGSNPSLRRRIGRPGAAACARQFLVGGRQWWLRRGDGAGGRSRNWPTRASKCWKRRCGPTGSAATRPCKRQGALPITMDEGLLSPVEVEEFIRLGMIDGVTIKPSRAGGLASARRQIEIALDAGLVLSGQRADRSGHRLGRFAGSVQQLRAGETGRPERPAVPDRRHPPTAAAHCRRRGASAHRARVGHRGGRSQSAAAADAAFVS